MKRVLIFGTFDLLHPGHAYVINYARTFGEVHVCLALDATVNYVKHRSPYFSIKERTRNLEKLGVYVHQGDVNDRMRVIRDVRPDIILLGHDQRTFVDQLEVFMEHEGKGIVLERIPPMRSNILSSRVLRNALDDHDARFVLVDKPIGKGSMSAVSALRKILNIRRVGFAGTLDPIASGLLVCGIASATRLLDWWHLFPKTYEAKATIGSQTNTYDREGVFERVSDRKPPAHEIVEKLQSFIGAYEQTPPMFSSKKVRGIHAYTRARNGEIYELKKTSVIIHDIHHIHYAYPDVFFTISCSTGTYVRSIIHDLGSVLGVGAYMSELRRTAIGPYRVRESVPLEKLTKKTIDTYSVSIRSFGDRVFDYSVDSYRSKNLQDRS